MGNICAQKTEDTYTVEYDDVKTSGITGEKTNFLKLNGDWGGEGQNTQDKLETHGEKK